jgi:hypothetical protein
MPSDIRSSYGLTRRVSGTGQLTSDHAAERITCRKGILNRTVQSVELFFSEQCHTVPWVFAFKLCFPGRDRTRPRR